jgi:hypothetical protein
VLCSETLGTGGKRLAQFYRDVRAFFVERPELNDIPPVAMESPTGDGRRVAKESGPTEGVGGAGGDRYRL